MLWDGWEDGPDRVFAHVKTPWIFHLEVHTPSPGVVAVCDASHLL